ncbi:hypothetical protein HPCPY1662_0486 [Helicobacter pylori CPY1662]|nr:hypothetical protein HPCPY1662_0486 [Helicobacter pylori CPY1662]
MEWLYLKMDADNKVDKIIKKLDFNGAIKTLRKIETKPTLSNHYRDGNSVSTLMGITYHKRV